MKNGFYVVGGVFDVNGVPTRAGFDTLSDIGEYFVMGEIGWAPDFVEGAVAGTDYQPGNDDYHLTFWHVDKRETAGRPEGWGYTASAQKGFGNVVGFARYGVSNCGATPLRKMADLGSGSATFWTTRCKTITEALPGGNRPACERPV